MNINQLNGASLSPTISVAIPNTQRSTTLPDTTAPSASNSLQLHTKEEPGSEKLIKQAVEDIQETVGNLAHNLRFLVDNDTGKTIIKVMDAHTEEIIRQIPTEEAIEIARTLDKVQGLLFNGKA